MIMLNSLGVIHSEDRSGEDWGLWGTLVNHTERNRPNQAALHFTVNQ